MEIVTDLHLHSKYSRAVSPQMNVLNMAKWAKIKGIDLLGTGDFTHKKWREEIGEFLEEKEGVFQLKNQKSKIKNQKQDEKFNIENKTKFLLTGEISSIYKQDGKVRKIHNLIAVRSLEVAQKICDELEARKCNIKSDGRPIIGISSKNLLEMVLNIDPQIIFIPCHIWTPWFSLYGEKSGFNSIKECFGDLSKYISAVETGISSDPAMNWVVPDLENKNIVSFSDAHSLENIGREATVLNLKNQKSKIKDMDYSYDDIRDAFMGEKGKKGEGGKRDESKINYTIEFYPEEGKYHYSGHRKCGTVFTPQETLLKGNVCPVCNKKMTQGVFERIGELGDLSKLYSGTSPWIINSITNERFVRIIPLFEIIADTLKVGKKSKKVIIEYNKLTEKLGSEIEILLRKKPEEIEKISGKNIADKIIKARMGQVTISPGFDGEYGKIRIG